MKKELRARCHQLDLAVLTFLAEHHGIDLPAGVTKDAIINLLDANLSDLQVEMALNEALLVHLTKLHKDLRTTAEGELVSAMNGLREEISTAKETVKERIADTLKGVELLKWTFGLIAAAIATVIAVGSVFGLQKAADLQSTKGEVDALKKELTGLTRLDRRTLLNRLKYDFRRHLEDLSLNLPDRLHLERVRDDQIRIKDLKEHVVNSKGESENEGSAELQLINCLELTALGLLSFKECFGRSGSELETPLSKTLRIWTELDRLNDTVQSVGEHTAFIKTELAAYSKNVQAVIQLKRFRIMKGDRPEEAKDANQRAEKLADEAISIKHDFARPHLNRANSLKFGYLFDRSNTPGRPETLKALEAKLSQIERKAQVDLSNAADISRSSGDQLAIHNNKADWCMLHVRLLLDLVRMSGTQTFLVDEKTLASDRAKEQIIAGRGNLGAVKGLVDRNPVILITEAELLGAELMLKSLRKEPPFDGDNAREAAALYREVIDLFSAAEILNYRWDLKKGDFLTYLKEETCISVLEELARIANLNVDYREELAKAAGIVK